MPGWELLTGTTAGLVIAITALMLLWRAHDRDDKLWRDIAMRNLDLAEVATSVAERRRSRAR
jgi:hypothetical protein